MTNIIDGKKLSEKILLECKKEIKDHNIKLRLGAVLVGNNSSSQSFIRQKRKSCEKVGIDFELFKFDAGIGELILEDKIKEITEREDISGLIIQLPLPSNIDVQKILNLIPPEKDIDILSEQNLGRLLQNNLPILPPTIAAIARIIDEYQIDIIRKYVVVVGAGRLVGRPLAVWLLNKGATFSVVNEFTRDINSFTQKADILISATGTPRLVKGEMIKDNAVIIDCGTSETNGGIKGDIDFDSVCKKASYVSPVPGGVGPVTVAMLISNLVKMGKSYE